MRWLATSFLLVVLPSVVGAQPDKAAIAALKEIEKKREAERPDKSKPVRPVLVQDGKRPGAPVIAVDLSHEKVDDTILDLVAALPELDSLNLTGTNVTGAGLERLTGLKKLRELHLENTLVDDVGLGHLKGLTSLRVLNLKSTSVSD